MIVRSSMGPKRIAEIGIQKDYDEWRTVSPPGDKLSPRISRNTVSSVGDSESSNVGDRSVSDGVCTQIQSTFLINTPAYAGVAATPPRTPAKPPWGNLRNLLTDFGGNVYPPPGDDEKDAWLESFFPAIEAAAIAESPKDASKKQINARIKAITHGRWRVYTKSERIFKDHAKRLRQAEFIKNLNAENGYDLAEEYEKSLLVDGGRN